METVGAGRPSAALPPINFLDVEKIKRDESAEYERKHSTSAIVSPSFPNSRLSESFQRPATTVATSAAPPAALSGLISPPESRRTSGDEEERPIPAKQSLPSIHEALRAEQPLSYPTSAPSTAATGSSQYYQSQATSSPADAHRRSFAEGPSQSSSQYEQQATRSPYANHQAPSAGPAAPSNQQAPDPHGRAGFTNAHNPKLPTLHPLQTGQSPVEPSRAHQPGYSYPPQPPGQQASPAYEQGPHSASSMNPQYGPPGTYPQYPYSAPPPPPAGASSAFPPPHSHLYTPSAHYPSRWGEGYDVARSDGSKRPGVAYGESVKRHLETFDVEYSLNEMAEASRRLSEFANHYRDRAHQNQRAGPVSAALPTVSEIDDHLGYVRNLQESMMRIRTAAEQTALEAQSQHHSHFKDVNGYEGGPPPPPAHYPDAEQKQNFTGGDLMTKKRRTRAAPPGRCHSCKRSETPEWRRGPDGARTLCNACGLHYAKLTRKVGNKANIGSSNLRPKNMGQGDAPA